MSELCSRYVRIWQFPDVSDPVTIAMVTGARCCAFSADGQLLAVGCVVIYVVFVVLCRDRVVDVTGGGVDGCVGGDAVMSAFTVVNDCLVGLVVKASALRAEGPGFESRLRRDFSGVESYQ